MKILKALIILMALSTGYTSFSQNANEGAFMVQELL
jgi:hypothetical protein